MNHCHASARGLGLPLPTKPSVILMPFKDQSDGGELGYLADGIRMDVQCALVKISGTVCHRGRNR